ncbi:hypothetical protein F5Y04DRAFT_242640 [Hypomontagnella monticulosa]|nr:hypothetical protein F5Y04DRAFT_242640 [Hypomontagnella monticulosa]
MILLDPASTAAKAKFSINPNNNLYFPFLLVQMKAHAGKLRKAERQCRTAAAFCFRLFEQLHDEPGQIMFTMTLCYQMAELFVVWTERAPDPDDPPIVYQYSMAQYLFKYEQSYTNTRCWVKDVLEWGYGERQDFIKEELKKFREAYVEDPTVADLPGTTATGSSDVSGLGYTASESE